MWLFRDYPDLYQALAALSVDESEDDADAVARFSDNFRQSVSNEIAALQAKEEELPLEAIADAAQWPETNTVELHARYKTFILAIKQLSQDEEATGM